MLDAYLFQFALILRNRVMLLRNLVAIVIFLAIILGNLEECQSVPKNVDCEPNHHQRHLSCPGSPQTRNFAGFQSQRNEPSSISV